MSEYDWVYLYLGCKMSNHHGIVNGMVGYPIIVGIPLLQLDDDFHSWLMDDTAITIFKTVMVG